MPGIERLTDPVDAVGESPVWRVAESALYWVDIPARHLVIPDRGTRPKLRAKTPLKAMLLGGEPLDGHRYLSWNFVSSSKERIEQAKQDWLDGRFGRIVGDDEFIPLPQR